MKKKIKKFIEKMLIEKGSKKAVENKHESAIDYFTEAIKINPENTKAYLWRMDEYYLTGKYREAIKDGKKLLEVHPSYPDANYVIGISQHFLNENEEAIDNLTKAAELDRNNFLAYFYRAKAKEYSGDHEGEKEDLALYRKRRDSVRVLDFQRDHRFKLPKEK